MKNPDTAGKVIFIIIFGILLWLMFGNQPYTSVEGGNAYHSGCEAC